MSTITITSIYDDSKCTCALQEGFGFSCQIEWQGCSILFDTGGNADAFFANCKQLNVQLSNLTHVLFSHEHWDHVAGLADVAAKLHPQAVIYLPQGFSQFLRNKIPKQISCISTHTFAEIASNVYALTLKGGFFFYEQALILDSPKGLIIITGCAHPGIVNILKTAKEKLPGKNIHLVLGGFHLKRCMPWTQKAIVRTFQTLGVEKVAPCHCTGQRTIHTFQKAYRDHFIQVGTGKVIEITAI